MPDFRNFKASPIRVSGTRVGEAARPAEDGATPIVMQPGRRLGLRTNASRLQVGARRVPVVTPATTARTPAGDDEAAS